MGRLSVAAYPLKLKKKVDPTTSTTPVTILEVRATPRKKVEIVQLSTIEMPTANVFKMLSAYLPFASNT